MSGTNSLGFYCPVKRKGKDRIEHTFWLTREQVAILRDTFEADGANMAKLVGVMGVFAGFYVPAIQSLLAFIPGSITIGTVTDVLADLFEGRDEFLDDLLVNETDEHFYMTIKYKYVRHNGNDGAYLAYDFEYHPCVTKAERVTSRDTKRVKASIKLGNTDTKVQIKVHFYDVDGDFLDRVETDVDEGYTGGTFYESDWYKAIANFYVDGDRIDRRYVYLI